MKTRPITPARIDWSGEVPRARDYDDIYHPRIGAPAQARHVFLRGNGLPERWRGRARFTILETGFGLGHNFLAAWQAWRDDPARCTRLHYVAVERHPPTHEDLARAHGSPGSELAAELRRRWPPLTPNLHALDFDDDRVRLLLAFGDVETLLPALRLEADAFFLDGFAPARNPAMWSAPVLNALGRKAAAGATAASWSAARELRAGLAAAGFEVQRVPGIGGKREISVARFAPRGARRAPPSTRVDSADALVVGAGIAGACVAHALQRAGLAVTVFDRHAEPAAEASGNPGGLVHGGLHTDDGPHARLLRSAALHAAAEYAPLIERAALPGALRGLLWLDRRAGGLPALASLLAASGLPPEYVQALDRDAAARRAGVPLAAPAWWFPTGGWIAPAPMARALLAGSHFVGRTDIAALERDADRWRLRDPQGRVVAESALVVLAGAASTQRLLQPLGHGGWPLANTRGQVSVYRGPAPTALALPVTGDGYALPLPDGSVLCGATRTPSDPGLDLRHEDLVWNIERARRLTGLDLPAEAHAWQGRAGQRLHAVDRLPVAGAVPGAGAASTQARWLARAPGLFVVTALGARGLTLAPLLGRLVAAMACGEPWPLEQDLVDAIDPGRWQVRAARAATGPTPRPAAPEPG